MQYGPELTPEQALSTATSWKYNNIIDAKKSSGNLSTASFYQKVATFDKLNPLKVRSHVLPQSAFFGRAPDPSKDPY
jgi:hypothetical protein